MKGGEKEGEYEGMWEIVDEKRGEKGRSREEG